MARADSQHEAALPIAAPPALQANLAVLPAAGLLSAIHESKRAGMALFRYRDQEKRIYFESGEVIFASSNQTVDRLGECLLRSGAITLDELAQAERAFSPGDRFGRVLVEKGILTPRELWNGVRSQVEEIVRSLFSLPEGGFWFWDGEIRPDNVVRLSLETDRLIAEQQAVRDQTNALGLQAVAEAIRDGEPIEADKLATYAALPGAYDFRAGIKSRAAGEGSR